MIDKIVARFIDFQIKHGYLEEKDKKLYQYGYQVLLEYAINILAAVLIAVIFRAYGIVIVFTLAFILVRSYVGGYHARSGVRCFIMSAMMQILVILGVRAIDGADFWEKMQIKSAFGFVQVFLMAEFLILLYVFNKIPIPVLNKPMSENERMYFRKRARVLYVLEVLAGFCLVLAGYRQCALAILSAHVMIFILVFYNSVYKSKMYSE